MAGIDNRLIPIITDTFQRVSAADGVEAREYEWIEPCGKYVHTTNTYQLAIQYLQEVNQRFTEYAADAEVCSCVVVVVVRVLV